MTAAANPVTELRQRVNERRRALGKPWWQIAVEADISASALDRLAWDVASLATRRALEEWLRRHPAPAPAPSPDH